MLRRGDVRVGVAVRATGADVDRHRPGPLLGQSGRAAVVAAEELLVGVAQPAPARRAAIEAALVRGGEYDGAGGSGVRIWGKGDRRRGPLGGLARRGRRQEDALGDGDGKEAVDEPELELADGPRRLDVRRQPLVVLDWARQ